MHLVIDLLVVLMFVLSTGVFFHEKVRRNLVAVSLAGLIASSSTFLLFKEVWGFVAPINQESRDTEGAAPVPPLNRKPPVVPQPELSVRASDYKVHLRFGGRIRKEDRIMVQRILRQDGWQVQLVGPDLRKGYGYNEIRYGDPRDEAAALALQRVVHSTDICPDQPLRTAQYPTIQAKTLEVWVSGGL